MYKPTQYSRLVAAFCVLARVQRSVLRRYPCTVVGLPSFSLSFLSAFVHVFIYLSGEGGEQSDIQVTSCPDKNAGAQNVHLCQYVTFIEINRKK